MTRKPSLCPRAGPPSDTPVAIRLVPAINARRVILSGAIRRLNYLPDALAAPHFCCCGHATACYKPRRPGVPCSGEALYLVSLAGVAELADALDLGSSAARLVGSNPSARTTGWFRPRQRFHKRRDAAAHEIGFAHAGYRNTVR